MEGLQAAEIFGATTINTLLSASSIFFFLQLRLAKFNLHFILK